MVSPTGERGTHFLSDRSAFERSYSTCSETSLSRFTMAGRLSGGGVKPTREVLVQFSDKFWQRLESEPPLTTRSHKGRGRSDQGEYVQCTATSLPAR